MGRATFPFFNIDLLQEGGQKPAKKTKGPAPSAATAPPTPEEGKTFQNKHRLTQLTGNFYNNPQAIA